MASYMARKKEPWKTEHWFVSPWNYLPEVTKDFQPPKQVKIHDITLRDGEQQAGITFTKDDKVRIAEKLAEVGVHRIEAGMPAVSPADEAAIREIVKRNFGPEIFCFSRCMVDDVKRAADCGVKGVVLEIPASEHLIEHAYQWPLGKAIDLSIKATLAAKEMGLYTVFFTIDATRADMDWFLDLIEKVATEGHMDALTLVDTYGVLSPHGAWYFTKRVKERVNKPLEIHFHADFGLAVANTIMSVLAGGEVIHSTVTGIGERAGNTPMEETALALLTLYGIDVGIKYNKLNELSKLARDLSGTEIPANRPLIGDTAYDIESGIVTTWYKNAWGQYPTDVFPIHPDFVGHRATQILMGKKSGLDNIAIWAEKLGIELDKEEADEVLKRVKRRAHDLKRVLNEGEFGEIVRAVKDKEG
jgi:isopropylmalate/homocitrate/citramalate synthase